jgi:hypothetical protein
LLWSGLYTLLVLLLLIWQAWVRYGEVINKQTEQIIATELDISGEDALHRKFD